VYAGLDEHGLRSDNGLGDDIGTFLGLYRRRQEFRTLGLKSHVCFAVLAGLEAQGIGCRAGEIREQQHGVAGRTIGCHFELTPLDGDHHLVPDVNGVLCRQEFGILAHFRRFDNDGGQNFSEQMWEFCCLVRTG
jgi:hypothetical protein